MNPYMKYYNDRQGHFNKQQYNKLIFTSKPRNYLDFS